MCRFDRPLASHADELARDTSVQPLLTLAE
jgi:hypothetical protein